MKALMKSEIKVEFNNSDVLGDLIKKAYFENGQMGKLLGKKNYIEVTPDLDDVLHTIVKGLHNATIKITNNDIVDGTFRFIIDENENGSIKIYPINIYCVFENSKYCFY